MSQDRLVSVRKATLRTDSPDAWFAGRSSLRPQEGLVAVPLEFRWNMRDTLAAIRPAASSKGDLHDR
jgi:hypothetical protein